MIQKLSAFLQTHKVSSHTIYEQLKQMFGKKNLDHAIAGANGKSKVHKRMDERHVPIMSMREIMEAEEAQPIQDLWPADLTICRKCRQDILEGNVIHAVDIWGELVCLKYVIERQQVSASDDKDLQVVE